MKSWSVSLTSTSIRRYLVAIVSACVLLCAFPISTVAQTTGRPKIGLFVKGGVDIEHLDISTNGIRSAGSSSGFIGGVTLMVPDNRKLAFQVELLLNDGRPISAPATDPDRTVALIAVPMLLRANIANTGSTRVGVLGGAMPLTQFQRVSALTNHAYEDTVLTIGADVEKKSGLLVDLRYNRGVVAVGSEPGVKERSRSRGFVAMVGWRLY